jgi:GntR family transcriptional regulator, transcriptional repressor for pyruvate dehydrogenase complex
MFVRRSDHYRFRTITDIARPVKTARPVKKTIAHPGALVTIASMARTGRAVDDGPRGHSRVAPEELFAPVRTRKSFEDVLQQIVDRIRSGQLREGDDLPGERRLAAIMEVSRPTVRLAIAALANAGVVEVRPGRAGGIRVNSMWIPDGLVNTTTELRVDETFELLEARRALEPRVAQLAALRGTDEHFAAMRHSIELQAAHAAEDRRKAIQAEMLFHRLLWQAAGNRTLEDMLRRLFDQLEVVFDMGLRTSTDQTAAVGIHERTLAAVMRGDPEEVEIAMNEHMSHLEQIAEDAFGRKRIRQVPAFLAANH